MARCLTQAFVKACSTNACFIDLLYYLTLANAEINLNESCCYLSDFVGLRQVRLAGADITFSTSFRSSATKLVNSMF